MCLERVSVWTILACTLLITSCGGTAIKSGPTTSSRSMENRRHQTPLQHLKQIPERIYKKNGWTLIVYITNKGSRSQGIHGNLYHNGQRVDGQRGKTIATPLGEVYYHGSEMERAHLWDTTGWTLNGQSGFFALPTADPADEKKERRPIVYGIG